MSKLYYRPSNTLDPEERLEDACLLKAFHDVFGAALVLVHPERQMPADADRDLFLGRRKRSERDSSLKYWKDPGFLSSISRSFQVTDLVGAEAGIARLHEQGRNAFLKSTEQKLYTARVPVGMEMIDVMEDGVVYSFIDRGDCLMVQEEVDMRYERRFLVMNGEIVTQSPVAWHLTPLSRAGRDGHRIQDMHYPTPCSRDPVHDPQLTARMLSAARSVIARSNIETFCLDMCLLGGDRENGPIETIEFNPFTIGHVGLYACDPVAIATAFHDQLPPEMKLQVSHRKSAGDKELDLSTPPARDENGSWPGLSIEDFTDSEAWQEP